MIGYCRDNTIKAQRVFPFAGSLETTREKHQRIQPLYGGHVASIHQKLWLMASVALAGFAWRQRTLNPQ